jgi:hypothetical protein
MFTGFRVAIGVWLLYNIWAGHTWALYVNVTLLLIQSELSAFVIVRLVKRVTFMRGVLGQLTSQSPDEHS